MLKAPVNRRHLALLVVDFRDHFSGRAYRHTPPGKPRAPRIDNPIARTVIEAAPHPVW
jgi:hypothetical protein